ncbi:tetratricopeptide repeat protein [Pseudoalteromonas sp. SSDWG2]|uniref:tetratricopeptide repeat protein n=1 Tax=Pseudoalteromonas sp. SSDWG2 TaxID=3139391 RepID=UPI003BAAD684
MNPPQFALGSRDEKDKRIVLANRRTLFTLTIATLALLWMLQPNRALLIDMLDDAQDPAVALAFLRVLKDDSPRINLAFAKQYMRIGDHAKAAEFLSPLSQFTQTSYQLQAQRLYAQSLLQLSQDPIQKKAASEKLALLFAELPNNLDKEQSQEFAEFALQIGEPKIAYALLRKHAANDHAQMYSLARQAGLQEQALIHAQALYKAHPMQQEFKQLLSLYSELQMWQQGLALLMQFAQNEACDLVCLQAGISFARSADSAQHALKLATIKAQRSNDASDWLQASELAASAGDFTSAITWLSKVNASSPSLAHTKQLHTYYTWVGDIDGALAMSKQLVAAQPSTEHLRQGVKEALALSDLFALSDFYYELAKQQKLSQETVLSWINYNDKTYGAYQTLERLEDMHARFASDPFYWFQLARFYHFTGQPQKAVALWQRFDVPSPSAYSDLKYFAHSFVSLGMMDQALAVFSEHTESHQLELSQLLELQELAGYTADVTLQKHYQALRLNKGDNSLNPYDMLASFSSLNAEDLPILWQYYEQSHSAVILMDIINNALDSNDHARITKGREALNAYHSDDMTLAVQLVRLRLAMYDNDLMLAKNLLQELVSLYPDNTNLQQTALWLAISSQDQQWLRKLYWEISVDNVNTASLYQPLAIAAQQLGLYQHANMWFERLQYSGQITPVDKLNWAIQLEEQGNESKAHTLRYEVLSQLSEQLRQYPNGEISYRSLLALFVSSAYADATLTHTLLENATEQDIESLISSPQTNAIQKFMLWQVHHALANEHTNKVVQLALAVAKADRQHIYQLTYDDELLGDAQRASALALVGENASAWQLGEQSIGPHTPKRELASRQRLLSELHSIRSHGVRYEHEVKDTWQVNSEQLRYYRPQHNGQLLIDASYDHGSPASSLLDDYTHNSINFTWRMRPQETVTNADIGVHVGERHGQVHFGQFGQANLKQSARISHTVQVAHNMPSEQSENLYLLGREDKLTWQVAWQPTRYEQVNVNVSRAWFYTDFGDSVGEQWQGSLRVSENINFTPNWQLYLQYDHQQNSLSDAPLLDTSVYLNTPAPLVAEDFISPKYQRLALGQQLLHGNVGEPSLDVPGIRYWFDASAGYNFVNDDVDFSSSLGLGVRVFGSDELFIKGVWQSADQNGRQSLTFNLGYFIDF